MQDLRGAKARNIQPRIGHPSIGWLSWGRKISRKAFKPGEAVRSRIYAGWLSSATSSNPIRRRPHASSALCPGDKDSSQGRRRRSLRLLWTRLILCLWWRVRLRPRRERAPWLLAHGQALGRHAHRISSVPRVPRRARCPCTRTHRIRR